MNSRQRVVAALNHKEVARSVAEEEGRAVVIGNMAAGMMEMFASQHPG